MRGQNPIPWNPAFNNFETKRTQCINNAFHIFSLPAYFYFDIKIPNQKKKKKKKKNIYIYIYICVIFAFGYSSANYMCTHYILLDKGQK